MPSNHRVIRSAEITLPRSSGDRDITEEFSAPSASSGPTGAETRPYLSYRVAPDGDVRLEIALNGTTIVEQLLDRSVSRTFNQVFEHGLLEESGNELRIFVPADAPGSLTISDLIVTYAVEDQVADPLPPSDPDFPRHGDGF